MFLGDNRSVRRRDMNATLGIPQRPLFLQSVLIMNIRRSNICTFTLFCVFILTSLARAQDWPMWRCDANRSAASPLQLPPDLKPLWTREFEPRVQAWDDPLNLDLMSYDRVLEPIVVDGRLIVGLNDRDQLAAYDANTGAKLWSQFAEGPVRLPPAATKDHVYFCSDDGFLYCVRVADGRLAWKFRGAPGPLHAIGNHRLVSAWPARGGPVIRDDTVYFAASIWPLMGTFIYALDAESGSVRWVNDSTSAQFIKQPHSAPSFAGVAPQGALVATQDRLVVPGGRSVPAVFRRANGAFEHFEINSGGKGNGGSFVAANDDHFFVHTRLKGVRAFQLENGVKTAFMVDEPVLDGPQIYAYDPKRQQLCGYDRTHQRQWAIDVDASHDLIKAGAQLIAAGESAITAVDLPSGEQDAKVAWNIPLQSPAERLLAADGKLFVVTATGVTAYGAPAKGKDAKAPPKSLGSDTEQARWRPDEQAARRAEALLQAGASEGYALWFGDIQKHEPLLRSLAIQSPFTQLAIVAPARNEPIAGSLRTQLDERGRYGKVTVHTGSPASFSAPRYIAHQIFIGDGADVDGDYLRSAYRSLRPYGGVMCLLAESGAAGRLAARVRQLQLEQAEVKQASFGVTVRRVGALPGAADWTHQHGDVANSIKSEDERVRLPLGVLWFGGSSNMDVLPRHGHGPPEQVVGGRLFIEGINTLSARDVYTGRVLWNRTFEELGMFDVYYDATYKNNPLNTAYNQVHIPGANARGTNYVVTEDRIYLLSGPRCLVLDPGSGKTLQVIEMPQRDADSSADERPEWGYIGVYQDVLIGGMGFANYRKNHGLVFPEDAKLRANRAGFGAKSLDRAASLGLVAFDRHTGKQLWRYDASHSFWHNGIVAGGDRIYCLDRNPRKIEEAMRRRGIDRPSSYRIVALDYRGGKKIWESPEVFGTWLGYSEKHDLLLQAGAAASDRLKEEVGTGMAVHFADSGKVSWRHPELKYAGPCILHNDWIITNANSYAESAGAFRIDNGKQRMIVNPITGQRQPWKLKRAYGCNNIVASEHLLTFRSGAAGFYDLDTDSGTGNLGGFKSGCTSNLIAANGVLNAPDYTRTCSCAYQNQTSLALVHMPEMEMWTIHTAAASQSNGRAKRLGVNLGAPGDRRDDQGILWLDYPVVGGESPELSIELAGGNRSIRRHASTMGERPLPWVLASGLADVKKLRLQLNLGKSPDKSSTKKRCRVRVLLTGSWDGEPAEFDLLLQGKPVVRGAKLKAAASVANGRAVPHAFDQVFDDVEIGADLSIEIVGKQGHTVLAGFSIVEQAE